MELTRQSEQVQRQQGESARAFLLRYTRLEQETKMLGLAEYPTYSRAMRLSGGLRRPEAASI
eukprot:1867955-Alexandrium_andersonii.AAC.1